MTTIWLPSTSCTNTSLEDSKFTLVLSGLDNYELSSDEMTMIERYKEQQIPFSEYEFIKIFNNIKQGRRLK